MDNTARITRFDRRTTKALSDDLVAELQQFAASRGLTVRFAGGTMGSVSATLKLEFGLEGVDRLVEDFKGNAQLFGLQPTDLGRKVTIGGETFTIAGLDMRRRGRIIVIRRDRDNSLRVTTAESVRRALNDQ